jgi:mRNA interferase MazF
MNSDLPRCHRGDIWLLDWNPRRGSEQAGFRPSVIVQSDAGNHAEGARTTILVSLTTQGRPYLFYVPIPKGKSTGLSEDSWANATQIITIDKSRLVRRLGRLSATQMKALSLALRAVLELELPYS